VIAGDFNVMPTECDVRRPERWLDDALLAPEVREAYAQLLRQGWIDALRTIHSDETIYTFWKYFRRAFERNDRLRIDPILLSPSIADRVADAQVDRARSDWDETSDHAPVWVSLRDATSSVTGRRGPRVRRNPEGSPGSYCRKDEKCPAIG